jgi:hypothetical protein
MAPRVHQNHTAQLAKRLQRSINRLTQYCLRKGKPVPWGAFALPTPNITMGRTPLPFSGGN